MEPRTRSALIIAADRFADRSLAKLRSPVRDAEDLKRVLTDPSIGGYSVRLLMNGSAQAVREAVEEFFAERRPDDALLLYLTGHGVKDEDGRLCFATTDTLINRLQSKSVSAEFLAHQVHRSRSRHIILMLDCCYSGAFPEGLQPRSAGRLSLGPLDADSGQGRGWAVITSCTAMEYAFEVRDGAVTGRGLTAAEPSVFTSTVVQGLRTGAADRDRDGWVSVDDLYDHVLEQVRERTPYQTPEKKGASRGKLIIARNPARLPVDPMPLGRPGASGRPDGTPSASAGKPPRRIRIVVVAVAVIFAGSGAGLGIWLTRGHGPLTGITCAQVSSTGSQPALLDTLRTGTTAAADYVDVSFAPYCPVVATSGNGMVYVWNMATRRQVASWNVNPGGLTFGSQFTADSKTLIVAGGNGFTTLWNVTTGKELASLDSDPGSSTWCVALSPDGKTLFTGGVTGIKIWDFTDLSNPGKLGELPADPGGASYLALSPDGRFLAAGTGADSVETILVWDVATRKLIATMSGRWGHIWGLAFSPDDATLAAATNNDGLQWWHIASRKLLAHGKGGMTAVAFSPDGTMIATGGPGYVYLWNAHTHSLITTLTLGSRHSGADFVNMLMFSRNGGVLGVGWDGTLEFWNVAGTTHIPQ